jgi:hypothetical protein
MQAPAALRLTVPDTDAGAAAYAAYKPLINAFVAAQRQQAALSLGGYHKKTFTTPDLTVTYVNASKQEYITVNVMAPTASPQQPLSQPLVVLDFVNQVYWVAPNMVKFEDVVPFTEVSDDFDIIGPAIAQGDETLTSNGMAISKTKGLRVGVSAAEASANIGVEGGIRTWSSTPGDFYCSQSVADQVSQGGVVIVASISAGSTEGYTANFDVPSLYTVQISTVSDEFNSPGVFTESADDFGFSSVAQLNASGPENQIAASFNPQGGALCVNGGSSLVLSAPAPQTPPLPGFSPASTPTSDAAGLPFQVAVAWPPNFPAWPPPGHGFGTGGFDFSGDPGAGYPNSDSGQFFTGFAGDFESYFYLRMMALYKFSDVPPSLLSQLSTPGFTPQAGLSPQSPAAQPPSVIVVPSS